MKLGYNICISIFFIILAAGCSKENEDLQSSKGGLNNAKVVLSDGPAYFNKIQFINYDVGFVSSLDKLHKSVDGGENWSIIKYHEIGGIFDFHFLDTLRGVIIDYEIGDLTVYKTIDGGLNWEKIFIDSTNKIRRIHWVSDNVLLLIGDFEFFQSKDAGESWASVYTTQGAVGYSLDFIDSKTAYVLSEYEFLITNDAGSTWNLVRNGFLHSSMDFYTINKGIINNFDGVFYSLDGGLNYFKPVSLDTSYNEDFNPLYTGNFVTEDLVYFAAGNQVYKSFNSGATFTQISELYASQKLRYSPESFYMLDESYGFAIANEFQIIDSEVPYITHVILKTTSGWE